MVTLAHDKQGKKKKKRGLSRTGERICTVGETKRIIGVRRVESEMQRRLPLPFAMCCEDEIAKVAEVTKRRLHQGVWTAPRPAKS